MGRKKQLNAKMSAKASAAAAATVVPHVVTPPRDPPTIRQNPRRVLRSYVPVVVNAQGLCYVTTGDIYDALSAGPQQFKGNYWQLNSAQFWGPSGLSGGSSVGTRLHAIHNPTGVDGDDRSGLESDRPRVGFAFPPAARAVIQKDGTASTQFVVTIAPAAQSSELLLLVDATCW